MPYTAEISRRSPTAFLLVIDQSGSMSESWQSELTRAQGLSDALNRILAEIVTKCSKEEGVRRYFDVGVLGYCGAECRDALDFIEGPILKPIPALDQHPLRVESRRMKIPDGAGGIIEHDAAFPIWFEPKAEGSTPTCAALEKVGHELAAWCDANATAYPPTIIHITDGEPTDGDPEPLGQILTQLATDDGNVLLFNLHVSSAAGARVVFPSTESGIPTPDARRLFRMSSVLPEPILQAVKAKGYEATTGARGYGYNADFTDLVSFFDIGTRPANMSRDV